MQPTREATDQSDLLCSNVTDHTKDRRTPGHGESLCSRAMQGWPACEDGPALNQPSC